MSENLYPWQKKENCTPRTIYITDHVSNKVVIAKEGLRVEVNTGGSINIITEHRDLTIIFKKNGLEL